MLGIISGIVSAVCALANTLAVAGLAINGLKAVAGLLVNVAKTLGLVEEPKPEVTEKALQAEEEGITIDKFDSYDDYIKAIDEFELNPDKQHSEEELLQKKVELVSEYISEKSPEMPLESIFKVEAADPQFFTTARMSEIGKVSGGDAEKMNAMFGLLTGQEKNVDKLEGAEKMLIQVEKNLDPSITDKEALSRIYDHRL